jgi:chemotaxis signal transduction protein
MKMLYLIAQIGDEKFAVPAQDISSVADFSQWAPIAGSSDAILGMASRRSQIITLVQLLPQHMSQNPDEGTFRQPGHRAMIISNNGFDYGIIISGAVDSMQADSPEIPAPLDIAPHLRPLVSSLVSIDQIFVPVLNIRRAISFITEQMEIA